MQFFSKVMLFEQPFYVEFMGQPKI